MVLIAVKCAAVSEVPEENLEGSGEEPTDPAIERAKREVPDGLMTLENGYNTVRTEPLAPDTQTIRSDKVLLMSELIEMYNLDDDY